MAALQYPWDTETAPAAVRRNTNEPGSELKPRGRRPASVTQTQTPRAQAAPNWLYHLLTVSGPVGPVQAFAAAARGSGVTPWQLDFAAIEEDVFVRAIAQPARSRTLTVEGCRILARQFRDRVEARQARAAALVGRSMACPFDLHALLPVPDAVLQLGPTDATALAWLMTHWGVTDRLRQVTTLDKPTTGRRLLQDHVVIGYGFFTAGETPQPMIAHLATRWPTLRLSLIPRRAG